MGIHQTIKKSGVKEMPVPTEVPSPTSPAEAEAFGNIAHVLRSLPVNVHKKLLTITIEIVDLPIEHGDVPSFYVRCKPEANGFSWFILFDLGLHQFGPHG